MKRRASRGARGLGSRWMWSTSWSEPISEGSDLSTGSQHMAPAISFPAARQSPPAATQPPTGRHHRSVDLLVNGNPPVVIRVVAYRNAPPHPDSGPSRLGGEGMAQLDLEGGAAGRL